nr:transposase [Slackia isoflavoniconvertens]
MRHATWFPKSHPCQPLAPNANAGAIDLGIPKLRTGSRFPEDLIERYSRVDRAVVAAVSEMVANGVSARKVKRAAQSMGIDRMGTSRVSGMCSPLDESVADPQQRDLSEVSYPYIWLDATYIKRRAVGGAPRSTRPRPPTRAPPRSTRLGPSRSSWPTARFPAGRRRDMG